MLAARVIPVMLCDQRKLVKGQKFVNDRVVGDVAAAAMTHARRSVDELMIIDVTATAEMRIPDYEMIADITWDCFVPVTVGGGVTSIQTIKNLLRVGADKVLIGAAARSDPDFVKEAARKFGRQAIVVSLDGPHVHIDQLATASRYAGEILLNDKDRDGTMLGYNLELIARITKGVDIPVIACGGCSGYEDMVNALRAGANAVAVGAFFQFEDSTPKEAVKHIKAAGLEART